jgi:hypothetical protein
MTLCPNDYKTSVGCKKTFCGFKNKKGVCSIDFEPEDREYEVAEIAEALQTSRQRVWRVYDTAIGKLKRIIDGEPYRCS